MTKENILIIADMDGSSGLTKEEDLENGQGLKALIKDLNCIVGSIRDKINKIYIWDFEGDENNLYINFGFKTKIISHPTWTYLKSLKITKVYLVGVHARQGLKNEFLAHTYSGLDVKEFLVNGQPAGETTLLIHLFAQIGIPVVFVTGAYIACQEPKILGLKIVTVPTRKEFKPYKVSEVRKELKKKAVLALTLPEEKIIFRNYRLDITFKEDITKFFKNSHFIVKSPNKIIGSSPHFDVLYKDFINGLFKSWDQKFRL